MHANLSRAFQVGLASVWVFAAGCSSTTPSAPLLKTIAVTPTNPSLAKGTTLPLTATGTYGDGTTKDITSQVTWISSDNQVLAVASGASSAGLATGVSPGQVTVTATLADANGDLISGTTAVAVTAATLVSIQVTPTHPSIAKGTAQQFTATGLFIDNSTQDLTQQVTWVSSDTNVATVSNNSGSQGLATGANVGSATLSASFGGKSGSTTLTVTAATLVSIQVMPTNPSIANGTTQQLTATGVFSDNSTQDLTQQATWDSSDSSVAAVSNASGTQGLATAAKTGSTAVSAAFGGQTGSTTLTVTAATLVSIQVTPTNPSIANGTTQQFIATGVYTDNSTQDLTASVTWDSSDGTAATISNVSGSRGLATSVAAGSTTITALYGGQSGTTTLTVTAATVVSIQVTPVNPSIAKGTTTQFAATAFYTDGSSQDVTASATWDSSDSSIATVSNASGSKGLATAVAAGSTTITATFGGKSDTSTLTVTAATLVSIAVTPSSPTIVKGTTQQFTATGTYSDSSTQDLTSSVTWTAADSSIATISNVSGSQGLATGQGAGSTTISAALGSVTGSTTLTVSAATLVSFTIAPINPSIANGTTLQFTATGTYSDSSTRDITTSVTWTSSNTSVATIDNTSGLEGFATAVAVGTATISASLSGTTVSTTLTVTNVTISSLSVTPANSSVAVGSTLQYTCTATFNDGSTQDLTKQATWKSSSKSVAMIANAHKTRGQATGVSSGSTTISCTLNLTASTNLTVP